MTERTNAANDATVSGGGEAGSGDGANGEDRTPSATRRGVLAAGGLLAVLGLGVVPARGDPQGQVGTESDPLVRLYTQEVSSGSTGALVLDAAGSRALRLGSESAGAAGNVIAGHSSNRVDDGVVGATIAGGGYDGSSLSTETTTATAGDDGMVEGTDGAHRFNAEPNVVSESYGTVGGGHNNEAGDRATVGGGDSNTGSAIWTTVGGGFRNAAGSRSATVGGGADNTARLEGTVGGGRGNAASGEDIDDLSVAGAATVSGGERNTASSPWATVGGGEGNEASGRHATVGGGFGNVATTSDGTVGGGDGNTASGFFATVSGGGGTTASAGISPVGGGETNTAGAEYATVAGGGPSDFSDRFGTSNTVSDRYGTVAGGGNNQAGSDDDDSTTAEYATVGGGKGNVASGGRATIPGGAGNVADGEYSFAAGREAHTNGYDGAVVFGDSSATEVRAQGPDEFRTQMPIYTPTLNQTSARSKKTNVESVEPQSVLAGVKSLEVSTWEFTDTDDGRHMGPMAGAFDEAFGLGRDDGTIATVDADGVAFAAIQGLSERHEELAAENARLRDDLADAEARVTGLEADVADLEAQNEALREQLEGMGRRLDALESE